MGPAWELEGACQDRAANVVPVMSSGDTARLRCLWGIPGKTARRGKEGVRSPSSHEPWGVRMHRWDLGSHRDGSGHGHEHMSLCAHQQTNVRLHVEAVKGKDEARQVGDRQGQ